MRKDPEENMKCMRGRLGPAARAAGRIITGMFLAGALCSLSACGTLLDVAHPGTRCHIYGGVRSDWEMIEYREGPWKKDSSAQPLCAFLDFPFSFVVDTIVLPATSLEFLLSDYSGASSEARNAGPERRCRRCGSSTP